MKIKIVGWLYIVTAALFFVVFLFATIMPLIVLLLTNGGVVDSRSLSTVGWGIVALVFGIFSWIFGSALKLYKKWSWNVGIVIIPLVTLGNLVSLIVNQSVSMLIPLGVNCFCLYALISEKKSFS